MKNRILRSALSVALCAAMLLSQGLTAFADGEIVSRALETSPEYIQETETRIPMKNATKPSIYRPEQSLGPMVKKETILSPLLSNYPALKKKGILANTPCYIHS